MMDYKIHTNLKDVFNLFIPRPIKNNKKIEYYNLSCSFDIETTSTYAKSKHMDKEKVAYMYIWQACIDGEVFIGRTWGEFITFYDYLVEHFMTNPYKRLVIYVHNLSFEFQFLKDRLEWDRIFALDKRKPIQAVTVDGIEFRCSYILSGFSLAKLSDQLQKYKVEKKVGDLDYSLIRHSKTPLTEKEMGYCINDILVVYSYIMECMENDGNITKIPLTKTGYVRNYCRNKCFMKPRVASHQKSLKSIGT